MDVGKRIERLASLSPAELEAEWTSIFDEAAPGLSHSLLRRALSYRLQERAFGGLSAVSRRMLRNLATSPSTKLPDPPIRLKAGTRLLREWNGHKHAVVVTDQGFFFDGKTYRSLSQIAKLITGAHWSGPRFFGLARRTTPPSRGNTRG